jgi:hypothetical protein
MYLSRCFTERFSHSPSLTLNYQADSPVLSFSAAKISRVYIPDLGVTENLSLVFLTPSYSSFSIYLTGLLLRVTKAPY